MRKEYNGGKAGYWVNVGIALIPALLQLFGGLVAIFKAGRKAEAQATTQPVEPVPTQDITS